MSKDYTGEPHTITELRAQRESDSRLWTPRDALVYTLRRIDSGEISPDTVFIGLTWAQRPEHPGGETYVVAGEYRAIIGSVEICRDRYLSDIRNA